MQKQLQKEEIERARQELLTAIYSESPEDRFLKKQAVKQLLGELIAARKCGLSFEKIVEILKSAGVELTTRTLQSYFFDLKTEEELATEAQRHAMKIIQIKAALEKKVLDQHARHAAYLAADHARRIQASQPIEQQLKKSIARNKKQEAERSEIPTSEAQTAPSVSTVDVVPLTLDAIEKTSLDLKNRTELEEDIEMRNEYVFYVSGKPFCGQLTKKQIHLLRAFGKIVVPTRGRSSRDFVEMSSKL
ncbi:hypothetical protein CAGGBEG34_220115 [Candidatus Glomeribacter gigasporarum BEG34]|uniref:Uncharacterized protein n=1 Tax=Candidatus Glomeribacter gigasporarum BEG34 TaxID=1070319 RepID=G2J9B4_9BURK|nr:hypothetical protein [Candidatus Glomeribacter gigasporarum]CCD29361.1 hypothetical protein CAGGBEG34_220115 [Candidatus Glomeribacter gigasporarum BEG34]